MQHCSISVTLCLTYTDDRWVKKLVRPWQFTAAICFYILLTKLTVLHSFRKEQVSLRDNDMVCLIVANNESCLSYMLPVNMPLTVILIIISISSPTLSFIPDLKRSFSANPSHCSLSFSSLGLTTWFPRLLLLLLTYLFYFLVFLFYNF